MNGDVIISPIYHDGIVHVTDAIPVTDNGNFAIAVLFEEETPNSTDCIHKCKECITFLIFLSFLSVLFFIFAGGFGFFLNTDD
jgi:hypothetical protein